MQASKSPIRSLLLGLVFFLVTWGGAVAIALAVVESRDDGADLTALEARVVEAEAKLAQIDPGDIDNLTSRVNDVAAALVQIISFWATVQVSDLVGEEVGTDDPQVLDCQAYILGFLDSDIGAAACGFAVTN